MMGVEQCKAAIGGVMDNLASCFANATAAARSNATARCTDVEGGGKASFKASRFFAPLNLDKSAGPLPAVITIHGMCMDGRTPLGEWEYMEALSKELASKLGVVVLMVGMHDNDEDYVNGFIPDAVDTEGIGLMLKLIAKPLMMVMNLWPANKYSETLSDAIDHLIAEAPNKLGVQVDPKKVALCGHSLGGGGVLYAAGMHCKERIAACVALNPSHMGVEAPFSNAKQCIQWGQGAAFSGEFGEGQLAHLGQISCPTLVYGSQAEYNTGFPGLSDVTGIYPCWPSYDSVYEQLTSAASRQLYVDGLTQQSFGDAHTWLKGEPAWYEKAGPGLFAYNDGVPLKLVRSFLGRHLEVKGGGEALPEKPAKDVKSWRVG